MRRPGLWLIAAVLALGLLGGAARAGDPSAFFGTYIGVADAVDIETGAVEQRDLTIEIKPYTGGGFLIGWETIFKVEGRRDVPGVKRRFTRLLFRPAKRNDFWVEVPQADPFRKRDEMDALAGDAVRWATIEGNRLNVYSVVVRPDGRYELEIYARSRTERGLDIAFQRVVDGKVVRRVTGRAVATP